MEILIHFIEKKSYFLNNYTKMLRLHSKTDTSYSYANIQNNWSEYFETRQGLRKGDALSTVLKYKRTALYLTSKHKYLVTPITSTLSVETKEPSGKRFERRKEKLTKKN
jgi:hypothetical protein